MTFKEIAAHYGLTARYVAENGRWGRHPQWPAQIGKRGRSGEYGPEAVDAFVRAHHVRPGVKLDPDRLYTVAEAAAATGLAADTIYADASRGRWPGPDARTDDGTQFWYGRTVEATVNARRTYRR
ncbi:hypothetical protein [Streptomyces sp. ITFR-16]|uniref:hypothetical protein n=1 Tax=Streptomyces sp. ITFR-16 TaxID=3075198 RepID=UPI00288B5A6F|nr:hypothetical protein [Streptomyces sp. ITFR-16]WNI20428.1 hypothetical protein RLT58_00145 [Streptomyces sp. ITFR-16]